MTTPHLTTRSMPVPIPDGADPFGDLLRFAHAAGAEGLLISTCGNASLRLDAERIIISATGSSLRDLDRGEIATVWLRDERAIGHPKPSIETPLHARVYAARPGVNAVIHYQSRAATLLACHRAPPESFDFIPEIPAYVGRHTVVPYCPPGSDHLADLVANAFRDDEVTVVQMRNHGQVAVGATWRAAIRRAVFFELACWMAVHGGDMMVPIPAEDAAVLRGYGRDGRETRRD